MAFKLLIFHGGNEESKVPTKNAKEFAHKAIDSGAHMVVMTHPHYIGTVESYKNREIFYGIGNFVFDDFRDEAKRNFYMIRFSLEQCSVVKNLEILDGRINDDYQPEINETSKAGNFILNRSYKTTKENKKTKKFDSDKTYKADDFSLF